MHRTIYGKGINVNNELYVERGKFACISAIIKKRKERGGNYGILIKFSYCIHWAVSNRG